MSWGWDWEDDYFDNDDYYDDYICEETGYEQSDAHAHVNEILGETEKAWKIRLGHPEEAPWMFPLWFPKSRCTLSDDKKMLIVPQWLMEAKVEEYGKLKRQAGDLKVI